MVKFIHTADWQLGMTRHFLAGEAQARFDGARIDAISSIGALATEQGCSFVLVCGDVFEHNQVSQQVVARAVEAMSATPDVTFYLLPGNHDPLDASSLYTSARFTQHKPNNVVVLGSSTPIEVVPGVEVVAAPWHTKRPLTDLLKKACANLQPDGTIRIAAGHGALDTLSPNANDPAQINLNQLEVALTDKRIHYVALGDRHSTTDVGHTGRVWYSGAPEPTDFREDNPGNTLVVTLDEQTCEVTQHEIGKWRFITYNQDVTADTDIHALESWLSNLANKDRSIVKLSLVGHVSLAQKNRLDELLERHTQVLASLNISERHSDLLIIPDDADLTDLGLSGAAQQTLDTLVEISKSSGEKAGVAQEALTLFYRLATAGAQQ